MDRLLFTYAFVHADWPHWFNATAIWLTLGWVFESRIAESGLARQKFARAVMLLLYYGVASAAIALTYSFPWVAGFYVIQDHDRILGMSALDFLICANLIFLRTTWRMALIFSLLFGATYLFLFYPNFEASILSHYGHMAGYTIGFFSALTLRFGFPKTIVAYAPRLSYQR